MLLVAGLWDSWKNRETGETVPSCTLIVTDANPFMADIRDRIPVFLLPEAVDPWLSGGSRRRGTASGSGRLASGAAGLAARQQLQSAKEDHTLIEAIEPSWPVKRSVECRPIPLMNLKGQR